MFGTEKNPKPPSFSRARVIEKDFSGNKLKFLAPPHRDPFSKIKSWEKEPNYFDIFNPEIFHSLKVRGKTGKQKIFVFEKY